jgi:transposase-like protein
VLVELGVVEQRYDAVKEVLDGGGTVTEVAERYGVTRQSLHNWLRRYRERGMAGLVDRSKRPRSCPHRTPARAELKVIELRREHPRWGPRRAPTSSPASPGGDAFAIVDGPFPHAGRGARPRRPRRSRAIEHGVCPVVAHRLQSGTKSRPAPPASR